MRAADIFKPDQAGNTVDSGIKITLRQMTVFYDLDMFKKSVQPKSHKSFSTWPDPKICQRLVKDVYKRQGQGRIAGNQIAGVF